MSMFKSISFEVFNKCLQFLRLIKGAVLCLKIFNFGRFLLDQYISL